MRKLFSFLSVISTLLGIIMIISLSQNEKLSGVLSFGTNGMTFFIILNLYNFLGILFALFAERNKYRTLLFIFSIFMILISLSITFVGLYGFQEP